LIRSDHTDQTDVSPSVSPDAAHPCLIHGLIDTSVLEPFSRFPPDP